MLENTKEIREALEEENNVLRDEIEQIREHISTLEDTIKTNQDTQEILNRKHENMITRAERQEQRAADLVVKLQASISLRDKERAADESVSVAQEDLVPKE